MKLIDTSVVICALGRLHPSQEACQAILRQAKDDPLAYNVDTELIQEVLHVYNRRGQRREGLQVAQHLLDAFPHLLPITEAECREAIRLMRRYPLAPRDAFHAAVVLTHRLEGIVSLDEGFRVVPELTWYQPQQVISPR